MRRKKWLIFLEMFGQIVKIVIFWAWNCKDSLMKKLSNQIIFKTIFSVCFYLKFQRDLWPSSTERLILFLFVIGFSSISPFSKFFYFFINQNQILRTTKGAFNFFSTMRKQKVKNWPKKKSQPRIYIPPFFF